MDSLPTTVRTTLLGAANLIRLRGWVRFAMQNNEGALCIRGAIRRWLAESATHLDCVENQYAIEVAEAHVNRYLVANERPVDRQARLNGMIIAPWNDLVCQSQDEAIRVLEEAATQENVDVGRPKED